ncbi:MAG: type VI secretion system protein VasJ [Psychrobacter glaciei]|jgi:type VI secretion system protein VasJ
MIFILSLLIIFCDLTVADFKVEMRSLNIIELSIKTYGIFSNMEVEEKIINLACSPISEASPCGINAKYEVSFERLESEISKSESLNSEVPDWAAVLKLSEEILLNTSKDYSVACYLALSYIHQDGFKGLLNGLTLIEKLSETFWDDMYPPKKRLRARQNSTQWLIEKVSVFIADNEPSSDDMAIIPDIAKTLKNIDYFLADKMDDKAPNFSDINRPIKRLKEIAASQIKAAPKVSVVEPQPIVLEAEQPIQLAQVAPDPVIPKAPPLVSTAKVRTVPDSNIIDVTGDADAKKAYKQIQDGLRKLANYHGQVKPSDPRRFRFSRSALWDGLDKLPPVTDNKSQLPAPPADKLKKVKDLFDSGDFIEAINLAEKSAEKMPYWFEGNRYICMSLDALGAEYSKAKTALEFEISKFTSRLPKILELAYANGTPFCDEPTKAWLASLSESSNQSNTTSDDSDDMQQVFISAKKLALSGKLSESFLLLNACTVNTKRDRFKIKMACAELACINSQEKVGIPMLERIVEETRSLTVAEWESDFLAKALALLVNAYSNLNDEKTLEKQLKIDAAYEQLCWYNPSLLTD